MDLLAGYGSGSEDSDGEQRHSPEAAAPTPIAGPPASEPRPAAAPADGLSQLPAPASSKPALFSGLPLVARKKRRIQAKFSVPIDYGGPPDKGTVADDDEDAGAAPRLAPRGTAKPTRLADLLPAPVNVGTKRHAGEAVLGGGGSARFDSDDDDDDLVPGIEDRTGMHLGPGTNADGPSPAAPAQHAAAAGPSSASAAAPAGNEAYRVDAGAAAPSASVPAHYIRGEYQGQTYYYDPATGQYFYPDHAQPQQPQPQPQRQADAAAAALEAALAAEASHGGFGPGGIRVKEVSGALLRAMDPAQRAELTATRSALGADYEGRLRAEAGRVGEVSKRAKGKHQLSSLYVQAKEMELEQLEKRSTGMKSKAETHRKYGW